MKKLLLAQLHASTPNLPKPYLLVTILVKRKRNNNNPNQASMLKPPKP
jgi:hypothetical protein